MRVAAWSRRTLRAASVALVLGPTPSVAAPQTAAPGLRVIEAGVGADTVLVGEVFDLRISFVIPPGVHVYLPDTLASYGDVESRRPLRWATETSTPDSVRVTVTYGVSAYRPGTHDTPALPVVLEDVRSYRQPVERESTQSGASAAAGVSGPSGREGDTATTVAAVVRPWSDLPRIPGFRFTRDVIPTGTVQVAPTLLEIDIIEGVLPRGAADVVGANWGSSRISAALFSLLVFLLLGAVATRRLISEAGRRGAAGAVVVETPDMARARALAELDRLLSLGLLEQGAVDEFYARGAGAVRRYAESFDTRWGPYLTSTELASRLGDRFSARALSGLPDTLHAAETVKFGGVRPGAAHAKRDWTTLRSWVANIDQAARAE